MIIDIWLIGLLALATALGASPLLLRLLRGRVIDIPNPRSSHDRPTPRGGGLAIVIAVVAAVVAAPLELNGVYVALVSAMAFGLIGLWDDLAEVPVSVRLPVQLGIGLISVSWLLGIGGQISTEAVATILLATLWITGYTNAFNFMDGINGIAAAQMAVAGLAWATIAMLNGVTELALLGSLTAGAALGFLPWNFPIARFFMGDVGSYFSGAWLSLLVIIGIQLGVGLVPMLSPLLLFGLDTSYTIMRRASRRENLLKAHRSHIYQRLVRSGWSHTRTTLFYTGLAAVTSLGGVLLTTDEVLLIGAGSLLIAFSAAVYLVSPTFGPEAAV